MDRRTHLQTLLTELKPYRDYPEVKAEWEAALAELRAMQGDR